MSKLVSVVIPAFNSETFIRDAIDSVLAQDYASKEIIVVDDGSSDDTANLVDGYGHRVKLLRQDNAGPGAARNRGVAESAGEYIAFLDSDDFWLPGKLTAQVAFLEQHPEISLLYHDWLVVDAGSEEDRRLRSGIQTPDGAGGSVDLEVCLEGWLYNELLFDSIMTTISVMMRRALFDKVGGFDESLPQGQDYDLWLRVSRETRIAKLCAKLAVISRRAGSISTTWRPTNYRVLILERALTRWGREGPDGRITSKREIKRIRSNYWFGFAHFHAYAGDPVIASRAFYKAACLRPWRIKAWLHMARALAVRVAAGSDRNKQRK